jgi:Tol biopolymer transport system component/ribosomal protein L24E
LNAVAATGSAAATPGTSHGYWFVAADGGIFSFGDAGFHGSTGNIKLNKPIVGMAPTPSGRGYWFVAADGGIFSFGDAGFYGSTGNIKLNKPIVGMAPTPSGRGYWFVAGDGGIFSFGDAKFFGSTGNIKLNKPIVGMAASPSGGGYWFVASDGGVFSFGDAKFLGSAGAGALRSNIVGMASSPTGKGYWFAADDGSVFSFGDAIFQGSMGGRPLKSPVVGIAPTASGNGYWLTGTDGGVFSFGDATFFGSMGGNRLNLPIVGMAATAATAAAGAPGSQPTTTSPTTPGGGPTTTSPTTPGGGGGPTTTTTLPTNSPAYWAAATTTAIPGDATGGGNAYRPWMSSDGRYVVFDSDGARIMPGVVDSTKIRDVYLFDAVTQKIERISVASDGTRAHIPACSGQPCGSERGTISADGRFVAYWSNADNLVPNDTNKKADAFVYDRQTHTTTRVSVGPNGAQADDESRRPVISRDGRYVAFESAATNLIGGGLLGGGLLGGATDTNKVDDIYVYEMATGNVALVSQSSSGAIGNNGSDGPTISANGRKIAFQSDATNLVAGDTNGVTDIYLRDLDTGQTTRVSAAADGTGADKSSRSPSISADGRWVSFDTRATNLGPVDGDGKFDIYVKDLQTGAVTRASVPSDGSNPRNGTKGSNDSSISGDGRFVAFWSDATALDGPADTDGFADVYVHDNVTGATKRVSISTAGVQGDGDSFSPAMSMDGRYAAFDSKATTLGGGAGQDIFVHAM